MTRRRYVAGNWKMWGTRAESRDYCERLLGLLSQADEPEVDVGVCPPFTALEVCRSTLEPTPVRVCAQNMHQGGSGAYTGEVSAPMLVELGLDGVILGHSERRRYNGETDRELQQKVPAALHAGLEPILCVGETEEEREAGDTERRLRHQVQEALHDVEGERLVDLVIAYEPVWAIGTGRVATPRQAQDAIAFVRALVDDRSSEAAERVRILYGGSVTPENAGEILAQPDVDGALVGGASLDPAVLLAIAAALP